MFGLSSGSTDRSALTLVQPPTIRFQTHPTKHVAGYAHTKARCRMLTLHMREG